MRDDRRNDIVDKLAYNGFIFLPSGKKERRRRRWRANSLLNAGADLLFFFSPFLSFCFFFFLYILLPPLLLPRMFLFVPEDVKVSLLFLLFFFYFPYLFRFWSTFLRLVFLNLRDVNQAAHCRLSGRRDWRSLAQ